MYSDRFDILCERYYQEILNFVKRKIGAANYQDAYDVTNKTFLNLTKRKNLILELNSSEVKNFIYSTAKNCCMQYFQENIKKNNETELNDNFDIPIETVADENIKLIIDTIQEGLSKCTEIEKKLFKEYWLENRKLNEIAEELHISYNNIRQMNSRLRNKITTMVQKELCT